MKTFIQLCLLLAMTAGTVIVQAEMPKKSKANKIVKKHTKRTPDCKSCPKFN